jgi:hypothetical protein
VSRIGEMLSLLMAADPMAVLLLSAALSVLRTGYVKARLEDEVRLDRVSASHRLAKR